MCVYVCWNCKLFTDFERRWIIERILFQISFETHFLFNHAELVATQKWTYKSRFYYYLQQPSEHISLSTFL
jgi:hypothetical protein